MKTKSKTTIGIDLGTTNSVAAILEHGKVTIIPNPEGNRITPSIVAWRDQEVLVGQTAKRQQVTNPEQTFYAAKRLIGRQAADPKILETQKHLSYKVVAGKQGQALIATKTGTKTPEEVSAQVLRRLKESAEAYLGRPVEQAVITVPAYFDEAQRKATKDAGRIAGLDVLRIINEPTAAALAFGFEQAKGEEINGKIAVYDLGGGTFDVSIIEMSNVDGEKQFEVLSTNGDTFLGGEDFDRRIINYVTSEFKKETGVNLDKDPLAKQRLKDAAENAKIELSNNTQTDINLPYITADQTGPKHLNISLTRAKLEGLVEDLVEKSLVCCKTALKEAGLTTADISKVLLVGGQTRMPLVQQKVEALFGSKPSKEVNPDEAVAVGAAVQGSVLTGQTQDVLLLDVTPLSLGLATLGAEMTVLIPKNTTIPTRKTETFTTAADNQTQVSVEIYQGERASVADNRYLGKMMLDIQPARRGEPKIEVSFDLDANGLLQVSAKDSTTGKTQQIKIEPQHGLTEAEIKKLIKSAEENAEKDRLFKESLHAKNELESLINEAEKIGAQNSSVKAEADNLVQEARSSMENETKRTAAANRLKAWLTQQASQAGSQQSEPDPHNSNHSEDSNVVDAEFKEVS